MTAVEIVEVVSNLVAEPFNAAEFSHAFLEAFSNKIATSDKSNVASCAENILVAREAHWPATIAELYDSEPMPEDFRAAHDRNDETLERIYIGRRFKNDIEWLETLFQLYSQMKI